METGIHGESSFGWDGCRRRDGSSDQVWALKPWKCGISQGESGVAAQITTIRLRRRFACGSSRWTPYSQHLLFNSRP
jgi:hypothetical protein